MYVCVFVCESTGRSEDNFPSIKLVLGIKLRLGKYSHPKSHLRNPKTTFLTYVLLGIFLGGIHSEVSIT